jgi:hypothetical protein
MACAWAEKMLKLTPSSVGVAPNGYGAPLFMPRSSISVSRMPRRSQFR